MVLCDAYRRWRPRRNAHTFPAEVHLSLASFKIQWERIWGSHSLGLPTWCVGWVEGITIFPALLSPPVTSLSLSIGAVIGV